MHARIQILSKNLDFFKSVLQNMYIGLLIVDVADHSQQTDRSYSLLLQIMCYKL